MGGPRRLRSRLLLSHLIVAVAALGTLLVGVSLIGPGYFAEAMGHMPGDPHAEAMDAVTLAAFQQAVRTAMLAAALVALLTAVVLALALSARIATPVTRLVAAARRIAHGHYAERVPALGGDEVGDLAATFNEMAGSLEATERRRVELVGDVAHELRTPIATLDGYLEGLEDGVVAPNSDSWRLLRGETSRLARLVNDLAELWRAESDQLPLSPTELDLAAAMGAAVEPFRRDAVARRVEIEVRVEPGLRLRADRDRVIQIVRNYLSNALRHSSDGGRIDVHAERADGEVVISVRDGGRGLDADELAHVFERFYRVDRSRSRALGGAGIGLAIVAAHARAMGGRVWAQSAGLGHGSTFSIALPSA
jgi:signal transduction histidine kinase